MFDLGLAIVLPLAGVVIIYRYLFDKNPYKINQVAIEG